jgi:hypothetical protein
MSNQQQRVVEKFYSTAELECLLGFAPRFWRDLAKAGELTLTVDGVVIAQPVDIAGELRIPASSVNAYLARHPYRPELGVKARNIGELRRKCAEATQAAA